MFSEERSVIGERRVRAWPPGGLTHALEDRCSGHPCKERSRGACVQACVSRRLASTWSLAQECVLCVLTRADSPIRVTCVHTRACVCERACVGVSRNPDTLTHLRRECLPWGGLLHTAWVLGFVWWSRAPPGTASSPGVQASPLPRCPQAWSWPIQGSTEPMAKRAPCSNPSCVPGLQADSPPGPAGPPPPTSLCPAYVLSLSTW